MTDGMKYCLATGNWGDRKNPSKAGVVQVQIIAICEYVCMSLRMCMCIFARIYILYRCVLICSEVLSLEIFFAECSVSF